MTPEQKAYMKELVEYEGEVIHVYPMRQEKAHNLMVGDFDGKCDCHPRFEREWPGLVVVHEMLPEA